MKSLFLRIFLSFWLAIALFVVLAILAVVAFRPQRNPTWESLATTALADSVGAYEQGGAHQLRAYLENLEATQHVRAHVFDEQGNEISGRAAPVWLEHIALGKPLLSRDGILFPAPRVIVESRGSSDGHHRYTIALALPQGPRVFFGPHGFPLTGLADSGAFLGAGLLFLVVVPGQAHRAAAGSDPPTGRRRPFRPRWRTAQPPPR
jgi:hypothetical protein